MLCTICRPGPGWRGRPAQDVGKVTGFGDQVVALEPLAPLDATYQDYKVGLWLKTSGPPSEKWP